MTEEFRGMSEKQFDWEHIFERHSENGIVAQLSGTKTVFIELTEVQIRSLVKSAWRKRKRVKSQYGPLGLERIKYRGIDPKSDLSVEFWYNTKTRIVETAYPVKAEQ